MKDLLVNIGFVVGAWTIMAVVFLGVGAAVRRALGLREHGMRQLLILPLIGWCIAVAFLQIWHFFLPVDQRALAGVVAAGAVGLTWNWRDLWNIFARSARDSAILAATFLFVAIWLANQTTNQPQNYDSGLYHMNAVSWAHSYPIVPGLANLHGRLGFNSSFFLYTAMLEVGHFVHRSHHVASGMLILFVIIVGLHGGWRVMVRGSRGIGDVFDALFLLPVVVYAMNSGNATSPTPDAAVFLLGVAVGSALIHLLSGSDPTGEEKFFSVVCILVLACAGICSKLSFLFTGGTAAIVATVIAFRRFGTLRLRWRLCFACIVVPMCFIGPYVARSVLLSGYPLYPSSFARVNADWSVPAEGVAAENYWIRAWAKAPGPDSMEASKGLHWVRPWVTRCARQYFEVVTPIMLSVLGLAGSFLLRSKTDSPTWRGVWLFFIVPVASLAFWVFTAPDPRFAGAAFWLLGAGGVAVALSMSATNTIRWVITVYFVLLFSQNVSVIDFLHQWHKDAGPAKTVEMKTMTTDSGLTVFVPLEGDQSWDSALPATPYFNSRLRLRNPADISKGFTIRPSVQ